MSEQSDVWPTPDQEASGVLAPPVDWRAVHAAARIYPIAFTFGAIRVGQSYIVGRKHAGEMSWTYTLEGKDLSDLRKARAVGLITTMQIAYAGESDQRDFGLLARRVRD